MKTKAYHQGKHAGAEEALKISLWERFILLFIPKVRVENDETISHFKKVFGKFYLVDFKIKSINGDIGGNQILIIDNMNKHQELREKLMWIIVDDSFNDNCSKSIDKILETVQSFMPEKKEIRFGIEKITIQNYNEALDEVAEILGGKNE